MNLDPKIAEFFGRLKIIQDDVDLLMTDFRNYLKQTQGNDCSHEKSQEISTGGGGPRTAFCHDCEKTYTLAEPAAVGG